MCSFDTHIRNCTKLCVHECNFKFKNQQIFLINIYDYKIIQSGGSYYLSMRVPRTFFISCASCSSFRLFIPFLSSCFSIILALFA